MRPVGESNSESSVLPPPGPEGRFAGFGRWMRARWWRPWLVLFLAVFLFTPVLMSAIVGVIFLHGTTSNYGVAAALNEVSVVVLVVAFPLFQRGMYRWSWHLDRRRALGTLSPGEQPQYGSEATEPPPLIAWPMRLRIRHAAMTLAAMLGLTALFLPFGNQVRFAFFIGRHRYGSATAGSLDDALFGWIPMILMVGLLVLLTYRQMQRRNDGMLDGGEQLLLRSELNWLTGFVMAFTTEVILCHMTGGMAIISLRV